MEIMAEFKAAVEIIGARSINALVHQMVIQKIREAKKLVSDEEFQQIVAEQTKSIEKRSKRKSKERLEMMGELLPKSKKKIPVINAQTENNKKKKSA